MDVETLLQWSELAGNLIAAASSLGVIAAIIYAARSFWDRRRWRTLANLVEDWAEKDFQADEDLPEIRWKLLTASWLAEAEFTPSEGVKYLDFAVLYAKARTGLTLQRMAKG